MSIGGPCLWIPSLSSPVSSLSAVTSHLSGLRHLEPISSEFRNSSSFFSPQRPREPGASLGVSTDMQTAGQNAENPSTPLSLPGQISRAGPYSRGISSEPVSSRSDAEKDGELPRVKLEIPRGNDADLSMSRPRVGPGHLDDAMDTSQLDLDAKDEPDQESTISPSDERSEVAAGDANHRSPSLDMKKKMKRFRLTHNQTRFLMSEFTRQAHPDAAHRERLSREIPGLTPRQVQVWFQNRRAKLKRLTTNDRERVLKSRALPDDFDTTKVLRTPFECRSASQTPFASPQDYGLSNPDFVALRGLRTDGFHRANEDDYSVSPMTSASTAGPYISSAGQGRNDGLPPSGAIFNRPAASVSMSDLHRTIRSDYPITRSSSLSDTTSQPPSFHPSIPVSNRFASSSNQAGLAFARQAMGFGAHASGMVTPYEQHPSFEGSVSPDSQDASIPYNMGSLGSQPQGYQSHLAMSTPKDCHGLGVSPQVPAHAQPISTMQSLPVSTAPDYRPYPYVSTSGSVDSIPYTQVNASNLSLPTSYASSDSSSAAHDSMQPPSHGLDTSHPKLGNPSFNYSSYLAQ
ncbi:hypothetical protein N7492_006848 [Penicillium capsulatum]|uniref:Homeobox domain-containing protein n=1 Tax=Penicillium capsulatum TaxID=69766 RepID=A0A9W9I0X2_9EURO|nr:hypothetical protein N7492_006848 [Penicillium capsulatum]KAJ6116683.1 hypothetical protein N7512_006408 [Penicillium capsulatum]